MPPSLQILALGLGTALGLIKDCSALGITVETVPMTRPLLAYKSLTRLGIMVLINISHCISFIFVLYLLYYKIQPYVKVFVVKLL